MQQTLPKNWHRFDTPEALAQGLTKTILESAQRAIDTFGSFHFITAGGSTPNRCYQLLSQAEADWQNWHIYMGDERVLPQQNSQRNSQALLQNWLAHSAIPPANQHFILAEKGATEGAKHYAHLIAATERFDLCLLGMGEDGHTASLFPGHDHTAQIKKVLPGLVDMLDAPVIIEKNSPKPPLQRISIHFSAIAKCQQVIKVISGSSKQAAVATWLNNPLSHLPIAQAHGKQTQVYLSQEVVPDY